MDRLYKIIYYEYIKDFNGNMVELHVVPDEDLILYLNYIPKLEPQVLISLKGLKPDKTLFQCEYYATVDNISNFYCSDTNYLVFIIHTNLFDIFYDYMTFPKANIKEKFKIKECEEKELIPFKGSKNPPLSIYNPLERQFTTNLKFKKPVKPNRNKQLKKIIQNTSAIAINGDDDDDWENNTCSHGICKAEQTTEPPLLHSLVDTTVEYFEHLPEHHSKLVCKPKSKLNIICFNKTRFLWVTGILIIISILLLFKYLSKRYKWKF